MHIEFSLKVLGNYPPDLYKWGSTPYDDNAGKLRRLYVNDGDVRYFQLDELRDSVSSMEAKIATLTAMNASLQRPKTPAARVSLAVDFYTPELELSHSKRSLAPTFIMFLFSKPVAAYVLRHVNFLKLFPRC